MPRRRITRIRSYRRPGRLVPRREHGLRAASVILRPGEAMAWHSTRTREELLMMIGGRARLELCPSPQRSRSVPLRSGQCAWIPQQTIHRVVNRSATKVQYLYVTASAR
ncbi:MAG: cupin domain-containing protein [Candidatus Omnitrophica bacterium]|nr:cupin domain-containing protein [Candidatus Omnitrophota bacterium]